MTATEKDAQEEGGRHAGSADYVGATGWKVSLTLKGVFSSQFIFWKSPHSHAHTYISWMIGAGPLNLTIKISYHNRCDD